MNSKLQSFLFESGLQPGQHVVVHGSFSKIRNALEIETPEAFLFALQEHLTDSGSLIIPAFTYCYKGKTPEERFNPETSNSKTGIISEVFRKLDGVKRTHSPTHSFAIWGAFNSLVQNNISPESPLGWGSPLSYLLGTKDSYILLAGTDFSSMSFIHFLEVYFRIEYVNYFPWCHLKIEPVGLSDEGEQRLVEVPGCSKSFTNLELALEDEGYFLSKEFNGMEYKLINVRGLLFFSTVFIQDHYRSLLCIEPECKPCAFRRMKMKESES